MSKLKNKISHTAVKIKWKVDQQIRINNSQTKENKILSEIGSLRIELADMALRLNDKNELSEESLVEICTKLNQRKFDLQKQQDETQTIKSESPPSELFLEAESSIEQKCDSTISSGLICPKCNKEIPVRFCPDCGVEGVLINHDKS
jgi:hypothetical protein